MRSRRTQTNEVGRCAVLLPALPPGPLALIEVGASAGLCLLLDQFYYELGPTPLGGSRHPFTCGARSRVRSQSPRRFRRSSGGGDWIIHPVDVHDEDAVRWLMACVWPDHHERPDGSKGRSNWRGCSLPPSGRATWSRICRLCSPRPRRRPARGIPFGGTQLRESGSPTGVRRRARRCVKAAGRRVGVQRGAGIIGEVAAWCRRRVSCASCSGGRIHERRATRRPPPNPPPPWSRADVARAERTVAEPFG